MESIPKFLASVITIIVGVLLCVSMIISSVVVNSARVYHASVIDQIEASNFNDVAIEKCLENAGNNGYQLSIVESTSADNGAQAFYKVTLKYNLSAPIFGKIHTGTVVGYALAGARMDVVVEGVEPGLYQSDSGYSMLVKSWPDLVADGDITVGSGVVTGSNGAVLAGDLLLPHDGSITEISDSAFSGCASLTGIKLSDSIAVVGANAFNGCSGLKEVELGKSITSIGSSAFAGCANISTVNYTGNIDGWCDITFGNAQANPVYGDGNGAYLYFDGQLVEAAVIPTSATAIESTFVGCKSLKSLLIPDGSYLSQISDSSFAGCENLMSVNIGSGVRYVGVSAFANCSNLKSVTISSSVEQIDETSFAGCSSLRDIYVSSYNAYYRDDDGKALIEIETNNVIAGA